ncbi:MAG: MFS transporter [Saprospiraceae bacterium]|nr:MFS transporter [Bacteroidia bacterium]NNL93945.1 MFS transporter [Saprospiraceae bacterium]
MDFVKNDKKIINGWAFFDWANSAFTLVISTAVFPPYFAEYAPNMVTVFGSEIDSNSLFSYSITFAYLLIAFMTPMLSGIADFSGRRKIFLKLFTIIGSVSCIALYIFDPESQLFLLLMFYVLGTIGFGGGIVFYNAYLPEISTEDQYDAVSAKGYAYGYVGSVFLLLIILLMITFNESLGIEKKEAVKLGFILVGVWWIAFAQITFRRLPEDKSSPFSLGLLKKGFDEVKLVGRKIMTELNTVKFLSSYFFFIAGVNVVILLASIFAKDELGFESSQLILLILLLQFLAAIGAYLFAYISDKFGNKESLMIQIFIWIGICIAAYFTNSVASFYIVSVFVGLVFGGIQSLSRSTYSKLISDDEIPLTSYFSFYDVLTKLAVVLGTFVFGFVNQITGNMRYSVLALSVFFVIGAIILASVKVAHAKQKT